MAHPKKMPANDKVRIQIDLTPAQAERFDALVEDCELGSRKELFNAAMTLFNWAAREVSATGQKVAAYDPVSGGSETVMIPALEAIRPQTRAAVRPAQRHGRKFEVVHAADAADEPEPEPAE